MASKQDTPPIDHRAVSELLTSSGYDPAQFDIATVPAALSGAELPDEVVTVARKGMADERLYVRDAGWLARLAEDIRRWRFGDRRSHRRGP